MFDSSPELFAAYRVLRRLLTPRHPPYALINLVLMLALAMEFPRFRKRRQLLSRQSLWGKKNRRRSCGPAVRFWRVWVQTEA